MRYVVVVLIIVLLLFVFYFIFKGWKPSITESGRRIPSVERQPARPKPIEETSPLRPSKRLDVPSAPEAGFDPSLYGTIKGTVVDEAGGALADCSVAAFSGSRLISSVLTSSDGGFELAYLPEGNYTIVASKRGYADGSADNIHIEQGETKDGLVISLVRGGVVEGRVLDDIGKPLSDASVVLFPVEPLPGVKTKQAKTDKDGLFRLEDVFPTLHRVSASHPDCIPQEAETVSVSVSQTAGVDIVLKRGGTIVGIVTDETAAPVKGANVYIMRSSGDLFLGQAIATDENGRFAIRGLQSGNVNLKVIARGFKTKIVEGITVIAGESTPEVTVTLSEGLSLEGIVLDEVGNPLKGADVSASTASYYAAPQKTDDNGRFIFKGFSEEETVAVSVRAVGYIPVVIREISLPSPFLKVTLRKGAVLTGRLVSKDELPLDFIVACYRLDEQGNRHLEHQEFVNNSKDYTFTLRELQNAVYEVIVRARDYLDSAPVRADLRGGNSDITIFIEKRR
ncbi:MAG: carboxypeptidase-like regulatory domain-containing protein [Planctomycetota bacterium]|nr:carboxypeptidase-like regulatory domain-containing protein [Planctomycetota bacterium]